ncbi:MAG TPA: hypothetical protein VFZ61_03600 [Polyangiales bacterium]
MDLTPWLGGALPALGAVLALLRERGKRAALEAEKASLEAQRDLENERQETAAQDDARRRIAALEGRMDAQSELISNLREELFKARLLIAEQDGVIAKQARLVGDLTRSNREYAKEVRQLAKAAKEWESMALAATNELKEQLRALESGHTRMPRG